MSKKNRLYSTPAKRVPQQAQRSKIPPKTMAIISVCAIILGIFITAHDYLEKHTAAAVAAQEKTAESLSGLAQIIPDYVQAYPSSDSAWTEKLTAASDDLCSDSISLQSEAYRTVKTCYKSLSEDSSYVSTDMDKTLKDALAAAEDAAVAYNKEARAVNDKVGKFPYNIVAKIAGYTECPVFVLNE